MTVVDTSLVIDYLLGGDTAQQVNALFSEQAPLAAPDLLIFEALAVLRRLALRNEISDSRASAAMDDLADAQIELFPSLPLRNLAWELRHNFSIGDALFVSLAGQLDEPLATKDRGLAEATATHTTLTVIEFPNA